MIMHRFRTSDLLLLALAMLVPIVLSTGCSTQEGELKPNQPPVVWLASAPPEGSVEKYTIQLFWGGWDPDGEIAYYEYAITDNGDGPFEPADTTRTPEYNPWHRVVANDSTFLFTADVLADTNATELVTEFTRSHTFFIRAVDVQGTPSREPAYRSFTARTLSPEITIDVPQRATSLGNVALVPSITTYRWTGQDFVDSRLTPQEPDSVQWLLVPSTNYDQTIAWIRANGPEVRQKWGPWVSYQAPQDSGRSWTTPPLDLGSYVFAIRAKDEAGAVTPVLDENYNLRRVQVSKRLTGPQLTLYNQFLGPVTTTVCVSPLSIIDLPAGVPLDFCWSATAQSYGGVVSGYRYGWDISDLSDPTQWETDYTPFAQAQICAPTRTFYFGTHTITVEVLDNSGFCSRLEVKVNVVQFTLQKNLILFDDFSPDQATSSGWNASGKGILPSDTEHDEFWVDMLSNLEGFDPVADVLQVKAGTKVPLTRVVDYKSIVWSVYGDKGAKGGSLPKLYEFIRHRPKTLNTTSGGTGKSEPNLIALFLAAGGHVFINGNQPLSNVVNRGLAEGLRYPLIYKYELEGDQRTDEPDIEDPVGDRSFGYYDMCVDVVDYSILDLFEQRNEGIYCDIEDLRHRNGNTLRDDTMREALPLDSLNFSRLTLRPEAAGSGKAYAPDKRGLDVEIYNPQYFLDLCDYAPTKPRDCFQPIYGLGCVDQSERTYGQPVAFWTSVNGQRVAEAPGAVAARSVVFGFPPVFFKPEEIKPAIEYILYDEWQLPRKAQ